MAKVDNTHHCLCNKSIAARKGGICFKCQRICKKHRNIHFDKNKSCPSCKADQQIRDKDAQELREREKKVMEGETARKQRQYWGIGGGRNGVLRGEGKGKGRR